MPYSVNLLPALDGFLEAASAAQKQRRTRKLERKLEQDMQRAFRRQGVEFVKRLNRAQRAINEALRLQESVWDGAWVSLFDEAATVTFRMFFTPIQRSARAALQNAAEELIANIAIDYSFNLRNPRATVYLAEHGASLVSSINETTRDYIKTIVRQGADEGWSYTRIAKAISERFEEFAVGKPQAHIESRAHLVAVTEVGNAYEAGNEIVIRDLTDAGLRMEKKWLTLGDDRVSDGCRENEQEGWIPSGVPHVSGDMHPLRFPGCRCTELYRRARAN